MTPTDRPPATDDARDEAVRIIDSSVPDDVPGYRIRYAEKAADALIERGLLAAGRAETTTDPAQVVVQKAISENERLRTNLWALQEQDERAEIWREKANQYHARLAAVEALHTPQPGQGPAYCQDCDQRWPCPTRAVLSAAPTDTTTKEQ